MTTRYTQAAERLGREDPHFLSRRFGAEADPGEAALRERARQAGLGEDLTTHQLGVGENESGGEANGIVGSGRRATGAGVSTAALSNGEKKENTRSVRDLLLNQSIVDNRRRFQEFMDHLRDLRQRLAGVMDEISARIEENRTRIDQNNRFIEDADALRDEYARTGTLDRVQALQLLEKRKVDVPRDATDAQIVTLLGTEITQAYGENDKLKNQNETLHANMDDCQDASELIDRAEQEAETVGPDNFTEEDLDKLRRDLDEGRISFAEVDALADKGEEQHLQKVQMDYGEDAIAEAGISNDGFEDLFDTKNPGPDPFSPSP